MLRWFQSFLSGRTISVSHVKDTCFVPLHCGVPQGSVLGPLLFSLYIADLVSFVLSLGLDVHLFADDIVMYGFSLPQNVPHLCSRISDGIEAVGSWLRSNRLLFNANKTKLMWCHSPRRHLALPDVIRVGDADLHPLSSVKFLGIILDSSLSLAENITKTTICCFSTLRRIRSIKHALNSALLLRLVNALVISRLEYCLSAHVGVPSCELWRLQRVLHASARLIYSAGKYDHVRPLLENLGWLSIQGRIEHRLCILTYLCRYDLAPTYLASDITDVAALPSRRRLCSASSDILVVPRVRRSTLGGRAFAPAATRIWNTLPDFIRSEKNLSLFKKLLLDFLLQRDCDVA